jgi:cytochrome P450
MQLDTISALSPEVVEDPYDLWATLQKESPVHWDPKLEAFLVSRYEDVVAVLRDAQTFSSAVGAMSAPPPLEAIQIIASGLPPANTLITADPPEHGKYRKLVARAFTPRRVEKLREHVTQLAHELVDSFIADGEVELLSQFAAPFPLIIIAEQLGVPSSRIGDFKKWSDAYMDFIGGLASEARSIECARHIIECQEYFTARLDEVRNDPDDTMLGVMVTAKLDGGRTLNEAEMASILAQFMLAGNETTTASIAATWQYLIEQPTAQEEVRADRSLVPAVMEEVFRLESPVQNIFRCTTTDTEIAGVAIPASTKIGVMYGAANHDPSVFPDPRRLDPHRPNVREHLAFGHGNHYCIGAGLARLEGEVALNVLLDRLENPRFTPGKNKFEHNAIYIARSLKELHLQFDA